jgi:programmed cell death 6-interacting protein
VPLALSAAIKQYISSKYDQHPDMFKQDLEVVDALRRDAVQVAEAHTSGIRKIAAYAGQLSWMGAKFPIDVRSLVPSLRDRVSSGERES